MIVKAERELQKTWLFKKWWRCDQQIPVELGSRRIAKQQRVQEEGEEWPLGSRIHSLHEDGLARGQILAFTCSCLSALHDRKISKEGHLDGIFDHLFCLFTA